MRFVICIWFFSILGYSCSEKKNLSDGFTAGTVVFSTVENDCAYTIKVTNADKQTVYYDPINLEDDVKKDNLKVTFKFRSLKMANRCNKANPISVSEIKKQ